MRATLTASRRPLATSFDVALLDLDGVVYVGPDAVPGAPEALAQARQAGMRLAFVTNNAARPPEAVAEHLRSLSIPADADEVITSAQAAAHYLADRLPNAATVLVVGTTGLIEALRERGLQPVFSADDEPAAVVQGYSPRLDWKQLAEGAIAIRGGALWVATNLDPTVPSPRGPLPGNGSMVAALRHATGVTPVSTGKPDPTMHRESVQRSGAATPIVVGDRLDTDIEGAAAVGCASLLVLSGVTGVRDLLAASPQHRPDYLAPTVAGLLSVHPRVAVGGTRARCGQWVADVDGSTLTLSRWSGDGVGDGGGGDRGGGDRGVGDRGVGDRGVGDRGVGDRGVGDGEAGDGEVADSADELDSVRALCAAAWTAAGERGGTSWQVRGADADAERVLAASSVGS